MTGHLVMATLVAIVALAAPASSAQHSTRFELRGACYCRAVGHLTCVADLTKPECDKRCAEALCDEWFWFERRPCWNWGYGG